MRREALERCHSVTTASVRTTFNANEDNEFTVTGHTLQREDSTREAPTALELDFETEMN